MPKKLNEQARNTLRLSDVNSDYLEKQNGIHHIVAKASDKGQVRKKNEDSIGTLEYTQVFGSVSYPVGIYLLCDGLGGYEAGEIASSLAVSSITQKLMLSLFTNGASVFNESTPHDSNQNLFEQAVFEANETICRRAKTMKNEMAATLTGALITGQIASVINIGDSRTYLFNKENGLQLITQDHSLVFRFFLTGDIKFDDIYKHPQRNQILRSLGENGLKESLQEMANRLNHPYFYQFTMERGDTILLCSDGLWQEVRDNEIEKILFSQTNPNDACKKLISTANMKGGEDNISAILVKIE